LDEQHKPKENYGSSEHQKDLIIIENIAVCRSRDSSAITVTRLWDRRARNRVSIPVSVEDIFLEGLHILGYKSRVVL
jgi:hypothetical protein